MFSNLGMAAVEALQLVWHVWRNCEKEQIDILFVHHLSQPGTLVLS